MHTKNLILPDGAVLNTISLVAPGPVAEVPAGPANLRDMTASPSTCTESTPRALRAAEPSAANLRSLAAASLGIDSVTRTEFHGSTCAT